MYDMVNYLQQNAGKMYPKDHNWTLQWKDLNLFFAEVFWFSKWRQAFEGSGYLG